MAVAAQNKHRTCKCLTLLDRPSLSTLSTYILRTVAPVQIILRTTHARALVGLSIANTHTLTLTPLYLLTTGCFGFPRPTATLPRVPNVNPSQIHPSKYAPRVFESCRHKRHQQCAYARVLQAGSHPHAWLCLLILHSRSPPASSHHAAKQPEPYRAGPHAR